MGPITTPIVLLRAPIWNPGSLLTNSYGGMCLIKGPWHIKINVGGCSSETIDVGGVAGVKKLFLSYSSRNRVIQYPPSATLL